MRRTLLLLAALALLPASVFPLLLDVVMGSGLGNA